MRKFVALISSSQNLDSNKRIFYFFAEYKEYKEKKGVLQWVYYLVNY
jgi:hypothetical protein